MDGKLKTNSCPELASGTQSLFREIAPGKQKDINHPNGMVVRCWPGFHAQHNDIGKTCAITSFYQQRQKQAWTFAVFISNSGWQDRI